MKEVKIGGLTYTISITDDLQGKTGEWGKCIYKSQQIELDSNQNPELKDQTLIHEILHAVFLEAGFPDHEEVMVDRVGKVLYQVLKDNDFSYLQEK